MMQHQEQESRETLPRPEPAPAKRPTPDRPGWLKTAVRRLALWLYSTTNPPETDDKTMVYDRIRAVAKRVKNAKTAVHAMIALLVMADFEELRWTEGAKALMAELKDIEAQGGFIDGFAPDQWQQIARAVRDTIIGARFTEGYADRIVALVKAHLEQQEGDNPSHERTVQARPR